MDQSTDRIGALPEGVLHHILSFLVTKDVIQAAATCNRLNQVWNTLPYLDFGTDFIPVLPRPPVGKYVFDDDIGTNRVDDDIDGAVDDDDDVIFDDDDANSEPPDSGLVRQQEFSDDDSIYNYSESSGSNSDGENTCSPDIYYPYYGLDATAIAEVLTKREKLFTCVEQILVKRRMMGLTIQRFKLGVYLMDAELSQHLDRWINYLVECNIKDMVLQVRVPLVCYNLPPVLFTATSLEALLLMRCNMIASGSTMLWSLRKMHLDNVYLNEQIMRDILNTCRNLECLKLTFCQGLQKLIVSGMPQLRVLMVTTHPDEVLDDVVVEALNLEVFSYSSFNLPCKFNIIPNLEGSLKSMALSGVNITQSWLSELIPKLCRLEKLFLGKLDMNVVEISSPSLKWLKLSHLFEKGIAMGTGVGEAKIDAPNMKYFHYVGDLSSVVLNNLAVKEVFLDIWELFYPGDDTPEQLCTKLINFLGIFDYSEVVRLECSFFEKMIFPMKTMMNLSAPLAHIKELGVRGRFRTPPVDVIGDLMDRLLWICPCLDMLYFKDNKYNSKALPINLSLKFNSAKVNSDEVADSRDCITLPWMRWRDRLIYQTVELKGVDAGDEVHTCLMNYFDSKLLKETDGYRSIRDLDCNLASDQ